MNIPYIDENSEARNINNNVIINVTPELAKKWLNLSFGNRPWRRANLDRLVNAIESDKFEPLVNSIKFSDTGKLLDGHHRLRAIVEADKNVDIKVEFNLPEHLAYVIDTSSESRSARDVLYINLLRNGRSGASAAAMSTIAKSFIDSERAVANGTSFTHYSSRRITAQEVQDYCIENSDEIATAMSLLPRQHKVSFASAYKIICDKDSYHGKLFFQKYKEMDWDLSGRDTNIHLLKMTIERGDYPKNTAERKNKLVRQIIRCYNNWASGIRANSRLGRCDGNSPLSVSEYVD